ncbi:MAG: hypothetical protein ACREM3_16350 [Candidatus Rokuibacteriota bacterium]
MPGPGYVYRPPVPVVVAPVPVFRSYHRGDYYHGWGYRHRGAHRHHGHRHR